jgi:YD repeat-containing protein
MYIYKNLLALCVLLIISNTLLCQNEDGTTFNTYYTNPSVNFVPPTPTAASFLQYGNTPVDLSSGLPTISIPIYTLVVDGVEVPISLSYHASGVKVDDISSVVGLKWNLNVGGAVYRTIKDLDDFKPAGWIRNNSETYFDGWVAAHNEPDPPFFINQFNQSNLELHVSGYDQWPDEFNYSYPGGSGDFIFTSNGDVLKASKNGVIINKTAPGFEIKDQMGNNFLFANDPSNIELNETNTYTSFSYNQPSVDQNRSVQHVSWLLDQINTNKGRTISFEYQTSNYQFDYMINPASEQLQYAYGCGSEGCVIGNTLPLDCKTGETSSQRHYTKSTTAIENKTRNNSIQKIISDNIDIEFFYSTTNPPGVTISGWKYKLDRIEIIDKINNKTKSFHFTYGAFDGDSRLKLLAVQEKGFDGTAKPSYKFTYNQQDLPSIGSKSKDYHGYYNGKNNNSLLARTQRSLLESELDMVYYENLADRYFDNNYLQAGILKSIEYPTGGRTDFTYEPNAMGVNNYEPMIESKSLNLNTNTTGYSEDGLFYNYNFFSGFDAITKKIKFDLTANSHCPECYTPECVPISEVPVLAVYEYSGTQSNPVPGDLIAQSNMCGGSGYLSVLATESFDDTSDYLIVLRIPKAGSFDPKNSNHYLDINLQWYEKEKSNGNVVYQEHYFGGVRIKQIKDYSDSDLNTLASYKKFTYNDYHIDDTNIYSSSNRNFKKINPDQNAPIVFTSDLVPMSEHIPVITGYVYTEVITEQLIGVVNNGKTIETYEEKIRFNKIKGGNLRSRKVYDANNNPVQIIENNYTTSIDTTYTFKTPSLMKFTYEEPCGPSQTSSFKSGYNNDYQIITYQQVEQFMDQSISTNLYVNSTSYKCVPTVNEFEYNDESLLSKESLNTKYTANYTGGSLTYNPTGNSNGDIYNTYYRYPKDMISEPYMSNLIALNRVSELVEKTIYKEIGGVEELLSTERKQFFNSNGHIQPQKILYAKEDNILEERLLYYRYDNYGNLIDYGQKDGSRITYLWSLNGHYPVAKLENISYLSIPSNLRTNIENATTTSNLSSALSSLRNHYNSNMDVLVTTMIYRPLEGVTSITDPKGDTQYFTYDPFGRLMQIKDKHGNILQENEYRYRTEN